MSKYVQKRYSGPYNEIAESLAQYDGADIDTLPEEEVARVPEGCTHFEADRLTIHAGDFVQALASMGPISLHNFIQNTSLGRRDWILTNSTSSHWTLPSVCPQTEGCLPLYPADRFNFGQDSKGLKKLKTLLASLPPCERPNILFDRYLLASSELDLENIFWTNMGFYQWVSGYALWEDERAIEWNAPMDYETAFT